MDKKNILVVDDDEAIAESFKAILQAEGFSVDIAKTGKEAIEKSNTTFYNLALLDIRLPDMEGTKLLTKLHEELPIMMKIMVTGYPSLENAVKAVNLGADAYVMKPVKPDELLNVVREKLKEQEEAEKMGEEKVADWIKTRIQKLES
ncbi:response regulator [Candidatus Bathyarchaeota archaeon]|nr:response regulator [Candidatus Bathyarchaeota archaeon]